MDYQNVLIKFYLSKGKDGAWAAADKMDKKVLGWISTLPSPRKEVAFVEYALGNISSDRSRKTPIAA